MADQPELFPAHEAAAATPKRRPWRSHSNPNVTGLTRSQAMALGLKRYAGGRPCKNGHGLERFTSDGHCVVCTDLKFKKWYKDNSGRVVNNARRWREKNPEKFQAQRRRELPANRVRVKKWCEDNPEKARQMLYERAHARRARKRNAPGRWKAADITRLFEQQGGRCCGCGAALGKRFHRDHKMPLALGGSNYIENIQLLCAPCNLQKGATHPSVWAKEVVGTGAASNG